MNVVSLKITVAEALFSVSGVCVCVFVVPVLVYLLSFSVMLGGLHMFQDNTSPLLACCFAGLFEVAEKLLEHGALCSRAVDNVSVLPLLFVLPSLSFKHGCHSLPLSNDPPRVLNLSPTVNNSTRPIEIIRS